MKVQNFVIPEKKMSGILQIRTESNLDITNIHAVTKQAFLDVPYSDHNEAEIITQLRNRSQLTLSLVAIYQINDQETMIGHIAISPVALSNDETDWYGIGPLSVVPSMQRQGVGSLLVEAALQQLRKLKAKGVVVLGDPQYYKRFGFRTYQQLILPGVPAEYFQALCFNSIIPDATVTYDIAFNASAH